MTIPASTTVPGTTSTYAADVEVTSVLTAVRGLLSAFVSSILAIANGGTGLGTYAQGDLLYASAANVLAALAKGTNGQLLQQGATVPAWAGEVAWTAPTLLNSWVNYDAAVLQPAGYLKDSLGFIRLRGLVKSGTVGAGTPIFTLPSGYRPAKETIFAVASNDLFGEARVQTDGDVVAQAGSNVWFCLDGINFDTR